MSQPSSEVTVRYVPEATRFEATVPDSEEIGVLEVVPTSEFWIFQHTEVPEHLGGRGIGTALVREGLEHVRGQGATVKPVCPFTAAYFKRHPEDVELVHPEYRDRIR